MKISSVFAITVDVLKRYNTDHPNAVFETDDGGVKVKDLIESLTKLSSWLYKDLTDDNIERVTRCYDCKYYTKYRKKGALKGATFYACKLDKAKRRPDFFCKDGEPRR